tara:strand:- start:821 stop:1528 length:708 start_codon:yes stop_codon:yes gene_type:complete
MAENWHKMSDAYAPQFEKFDSPFLVSKFSASEYAIDPTYWLFKLARYKHCSRLLEGCKNVLEIGAGDSFASPMVASKVENLICCEEFPDLCKYSSEHIPTIAPNIEIVNCSFPSEAEKLVEKIKDSRNFDAIYSLDVFEHIPKDATNAFMQKCVDILDNNGIYICGIPSLESQQYASEGSKIGHVNCMSKSELKQFLSTYFINTFVFSMNDEVLHTGYGPMSHYLLALCTGPLKK